MHLPSNFPPAVPACAVDAEHLSKEHIELYTGWFAVQVMGRQERRVASMLEYKGYEQFVPCRKSTRKPRARQVAEPQPLFPGYVFCRGRGRVNGLIVTTPGVVRILGHGGVPAAVPPEEIRNIHLVVNSGLPSELHELLQIGGAVMVMEGPLRGVIGSLIRFKNQQRLAVSVNLLHRSVTVEMNNWEVRPVAPSHPSAASAVKKVMVAAS